MNLGPNLGQVRLGSGLNLGSEPNPTIPIHMGIKMIKWGMFHVCDNFGLLAFVATPNIVFDEFV